MIAALYVETNGIYSGLENVELWGKERDARFYAGPWPVVAHPPCERWCRFAKGIETRYGYAVGDDGGCFEAALRAVRMYGGVLEHPAHSLAWSEFGLPVPPKDGGWSTNIGGGWSAYVEQGRYGHPMRKATWLYTTHPRELRWGFRPDAEALGPFKWGSRLDGPAHVRDRPRCDREHALTPPAFRDELLRIASEAGRGPMSIGLARYMSDA